MAKGEKIDFGWEEGGEIITGGIKTGQEKGENKI